MGEEPHILPEAVTRPQTPPVGWNTLVTTVIHWSDEFGPIVISAAALAVVLGGLVFWASGPPSVGHEGVLHVESDPRGLEVQINGELRGRTPVALTLTPGLYSIRLEHGGHVKQIEAFVAEGKETTHHISWSQATPAELAVVAQVFRTNQAALATLQKNQDEISRLTTEYTKQVADYLAVLKSEIARREAAVLAKKPIPRFRPPRPPRAVRRPRSASGEIPPAPPAARRPTPAFSKW